MRPCDRLLQAVTMPAAIGTKSFLLIGVASLLHAKAIGTPPTQNSAVTRKKSRIRAKHSKSVFQKSKKYDFGPKVQPGF